MKEPNVTIITTVYSASDDFLKKMSNSIKEQKYSGKIIHIFINDNAKIQRKIKGLNILNNEKNVGLSATLKKGFELAKTEIIVSLLDDCIPSSDDWLRNLIAPLKDKEVVATSSKVELPKELWDSFDYFTRALTEKEQKIIIPGLDEKGCAYRKSIMKEYGYFDSEYFRNGGEDVDVTVKMEERGKIINTDAKVFHLHNTNIKSRIKKEIQYARIAGLITRKMYFKLQLYYKVHVALKIGLFLLFLVSLIFNFHPIIIFILMFGLANIRFPFQFKRLWKDFRIILVPFLNLFIYVLYVINLLYSLIFNVKI